MASSDAKLWQKIREAAENMHCALAAHWRCPATHRHAAGLRLESRIAHGQDLDPAFRFGVFLTGNLSSGRSHSPGVWQELEVAPTYSQLGRAPLAPTSQAAVPKRKKTSQSHLRLSLLWSPPSISKKQPKQTQNPQTPDSPKIRDLCSWQQTTPRVDEPSLGFLEHQGWKHHIFKGDHGRERSLELSLLPLRDCVGGSAIQTACLSQVEHEGKVGVVDPSNGLG